MKKIIALMLAICSFLSVMAILTSCKKEPSDTNGTESSSQSESDTEKPISTTVTKEEWLPIFESLYEGNFHAAMRDEYYEATTTVTENLIKETRTGGGTAYTQYRTNENGITILYEEIDGVWYRHPEISDSWSNGVFDGHYRSWEDEYGWSTEGIVEDVLPIELLDYDLFTYDEENKYYFCEVIEIKYDYGSDYLKNFYAYFKGGELLKINYDFHDNDANSAPIYNVTFTREEEYLDISLPDESKVISLPTDYSKVENKFEIITEYDWQSAIISFQSSNMIRVESDTYKATILPEKIKEENEFGTVYYSFENGVPYRYDHDKGENAWIKESMEDGNNETDNRSIWELRLRECITQYTGDRTNFIMPEIYWAYNTFDFDTDTHEYFIEEYESEIHDNVFKNIRIAFKSGEIVKISFECLYNYEWSSVVMTPAQENSITLPAVKS